MTIKQRIISPNTIETYQRLAVERLVIYQFLSTIYCHSPRIDTVKKLLSKGMIDFLEQLYGMPLMNNEASEGLKLIHEFIEESSQQEFADLQTKLAVEHTKLLRGLRPGYGPKPPYESVYRSKSKQPSKEILRQIHCFYAELGVVKDLRDQLDYIGLEFDLMRYLIEQEIEAWENGQEDQAAVYLDKQWELLCDHISCWVPQFCQEMLSQADLKFYQGIALVTYGYITDDLNQLKTAWESTRLEL